MVKKTIIYYTDNSVDPKIYELCRKQLLSVSGEHDIVSVSHKPIDIGKNICVGEIGRSYNSYYKQILIGAKEAKTDYVATVEHDVLYSGDHFNYTPVSDDIFFYDKNVWFVNYETGEYSYYPRNVQSMMICHRDLLIQAIEEKLLQTETDYPSTGRAKYTCEPGVCDNRPEFIEEKTKWCNKYGRTFKQFRSESFMSSEPCIDIRHNTNFSRPGSYKVASKQTFTIPYWGNFREYEHNNLSN